MTEQDRAYIASRSPAQLAAMGISEQDRSYILSRSPEQLASVVLPSAPAPIQTILTSPIIKTIPPPVYMAARNGGADVSLLSKIAKGAVNVASNFIPGGNLVKSGIQAGISALTSGGRTRAATSMATVSPLVASLPQTITRMLPGVGTGIGAAETIRSLTSNSSANGCGCRSSGRDSCTGQKKSRDGAPLATFFGGCCPPGRVLRRVNNGRDICARQARMNVFNPSALARADRRITGFARRAAPILKDMGYTVSSARKVKLKFGKKRRRAS